MAKERYGNEATRNDGRTSWIKLVPQVEAAMNHTIQLTTKKRPIDLFNEGETNETVVDRVRALAAKGTTAVFTRKGNLRQGIR